MELIKITRMALLASLLTLTACEEILEQSEEDNTEQVDDGGNNDGGNNDGGSGDNTHENGNLATLVAANGDVIIQDLDGSTSTANVVYGDMFNTENAPGVYDMLIPFTEDGEVNDEVIVVTIASGGSGTIDFGEDDGEPDLNPITWQIAAEGYLQFTEQGDDGEEWYFTIVPIVSDSGNAVIDVYTPDDQEDAADVTLIGDFTKQMVDEGNGGEGEQETSSLIGENGVVELKDEEGNVSNETVALDTQFDLSTVEGTYALYGDEEEMDEAIIVKVEANGQGTIDFGLDDDGNPDINDIAWALSSEGYLTFTETDGYGDVWYFTIVNVVSETGNALIDIYTPEEQEDYTDITLIAYFTKQQDMAETSNALVGTYVLGEGNNYNVLAILDNSRYYVGHTNNTENNNAVSGEFGTYTWDEETGAFQATIVGQSDGQGGIGEDQETWTMNGNQLTIDEDNEANSGDEITVAKMSYTSGSIIGAWYLEENGEDDYNIVVFQDDGRYFVMHSNNKESDENCSLLAVSGEFGTYTNTNGLIATTIIGESDCEGGFSNENIKLTMNDEGNLDADAENDGSIDYTLTRIE